MCWEEGSWGRANTGVAAEQRRQRVRRDGAWTCGGAARRGRARQIRGPTRGPGCCKHPLDDAMGMLLAQALDSGGRRADAAMAAVLEASAGGVMLGVVLQSCEAAARSHAARLQLRLPGGRRSPARMLDVLDSQLSGLHHHSSTPAPATPQVRSPGLLSQTTLSLSSLSPPAV